ncbi:MAG: hypothetical protein F4213_12005 [Boseongicola sp. SB0677_bin_26]|nr:hypothetical protein [Boseongicola sp. SB0665_bin_10]MYG26729.1 hypothetical protein [Boseongicola sp. SB0677_bin_26]
MFEVPKEAAALKWPYADAESLIAAAKTERKAREAIARQWISEGVPFAFKDCPALYEYIRDWIGKKLDVPAKSVAVTGSASLGQSLARKKLGQNFGEGSDLDFFIVSETLFQNVSDDFHNWSADYKSGAIHPRNPREASFWDSNLNEVPHNIRHGFMNTDRVPNLTRYPTTRSANEIMSRLVSWCKKSQDPIVPMFQRASIRCYKNWGSVIAQLSLNLNFISKSKNLHK